MGYGKNWEELEDGSWQHESFGVTYVVRRVNNGSWVVGFPGGHNMQEEFLTAREAKRSAETMIYYLYKESRTIEARRRKYYWAEIAFINSMEDLRARSSIVATQYDVTQAAGLIRRLVLDRNPLAVVTAKKYSISPLFGWTGDMNVIESEFHSPLLISGSSLDHDLSSARSRGGLASAGSITWGPLEELLSTEVIHDTESNRTVAVKEVVSWFAHERGGVHLGMDTKTENKDILENCLRFEPAHLKWTIIAIARIVYKGLEKTLYEAAAAASITTYDL